MTMRLSFLIPFSVLLLLLSPYYTVAASAFTKHGGFPLMQRRQRHLPPKKWRCPTTTTTTSARHMPLLVRGVQNFHSFSPNKSSSTQLMMMAPQSIGLYWSLILRGGAAAAEILSDSTLADEAFDWCANLSSPAALVSGAVLATLSQTREDLVPRKEDSNLYRFAKRFCRALLLSSFGLEIFCIFVSTVTGTMLLSHGDIPAGVHAGIHYHSPMGFLNHNHEFEYLTARVTFLQGLLNWLLAVALETFIPKQNEGKGARKMNKFISASLGSMILLIVKFYNDHISFYSHYGEMLWRYATITWTRFFWSKPIRPLQFISLPWVLFTVYLGWEAFAAPSDEDAD